MKEIIIKTNDATTVEKLDAAIKAAEGRATARTITGRGIIDALQTVTDKLDITKKALNGVSVSVDIHAQKFPSAYRYTPESTFFDAVFKSGSWRVTRIYREATRNSWYNTYHVNLTPDAEKALLGRYRAW